MKLLDYIRGLRKGKEAHRLEQESMQDPFLADAMDGYSQVEGNHEQRIKKLRMQVSAHSAKKKNTRAITWSIAACLVIGFGISSYLLFLKKSMTDEEFIAKESVSIKLAEPAALPTPVMPAPPTVPATPQKEIALATAKGKADKKDMAAKIQTTSQPQGAPVAAVPVMEDIPEEIRVDTSRAMLIAMNENKQALNEVVAVAYGTQKKRKSTTVENVVTVKEQVKKESTPQPVIGKRNYQKYLKRNLVRPTDNNCKDIKGEVVLSFFVDKEGKPQNITIIHGLCESANKEAIRLVKEGPKWTSGKLPARVTVRF